MVRSFLLRALVASLLLSLFCWPSLAADKTPPADDHEAAREAVRQALVAETLGDNTQRARKLGEAILAAPDLETANWHLARVKSGDKWLPLADAESQVADDTTLAEYRKLRDKATTPRLIQALANWCLKQRQTDLAELHFAQLLARKDATPAMREEAIKRLGLVQANGVWLRKDELEARQAEAKAVQEALMKWRPKLKELQLVIDGPDFAKRDKAIAHLNQLDDPETIPALESFLLDGRADFQEQAVKRLGTFKHYEATEALVRFAVLAESSIVRDAAIKQLEQRPAHEFVPLLLGGLASPIQSRYQVGTDGRGNIRYVQAIFREGISSNQLLLTNQIAVGVFSSSRNIDSSDVKVVPRDQPASTKIDSGVVVGSHAQALREQRAKARLTAANVQSQVQLANSQVEIGNRRLFEALEALTKQQLPREAPAWWSWWQQKNEYSWPKPTAYLYLWNGFEYYAHQHTSAKISGTRHPSASCFLAGTPIRTQAGLVPIETIQPGDRVLSQDQNSGELTYKLVLRTTLRPPAKMVTITAGSEAITTTLGHPFWVSGHGWKMAKELKAGDRLHSHGGAIEVTSIEPLDRPEPAHNLVVADFNSYFVGNQGLLVHDNEFRQPTRAVVPGLVLSSE